MGFRDAWRQLIAPLPMERRGANPFSEWGTTAPPPPGSVGGTVGGLGVTTESASQVSAVYGCVGLLADSVASLPLRVLDKPATVNTAKELPSPKLLEKPYELISLTDWLVGFIWALALRGNFFGRVIERDRLGHPSQIMPVNPDVAKVLAKPGDSELEYRYAGELIPNDDVIHVRYQSMPGMILGLNPIQCMRYSFGLAHVLDIHAEQYFANSAQPDGVIQVKRELNMDAAKKLKSGWDAAHQGPHKSGNVGILDNEAEYRPISINPTDQQLLESRKFSQEEIVGMVFRIPPHMLGLNERSTSFGRGIEQQERTFVQNTLQGYLCRVEELLTACLPRGQFANFDIRHRIRGDEIQRAETSYKMILAGAWTGDDARALFDMPPLPNGEGKQVHSPTNSELLKMQLEELEKTEEEPSEEEKATKEAQAMAARPVIEPPKANGKGPKKNVPAPAK